LPRAGTLQEFVKACGQDPRAWLEARGRVARSAPRATPEAIGPLQAEPDAERSLIDRHDLAEADRDPEEQSTSSRPPDALDQVSCRIGVYRIACDLARARARALDTLFRGGYTLDLASVLNLGRVLDLVRARARELDLARDLHPALDHAVDIALDLHHALEHTIALAHERDRTSRATVNNPYGSPSTAYAFSSDRDVIRALSQARSHVRTLARTLAASPLYVSELDLSHIDIEVEDWPALSGVFWTYGGTRWPKHVEAEIRKWSDPKPEPSPYSEYKVRDVTAGDEDLRSWPTIYRR
jgi:hypothetical protein